MRIVLLFFLINVSFSFQSCHKSRVEKVIKQAGENEQELQRVLNYYSVDQPNHLKYKAAIFLIENMSKYRSIDQSKKYKEAFKIAKKARNEYKKINVDYKTKEIALYANVHFSKAIDSIKNSFSVEKNSTYEYDIRSIDSNFLIENIDIAFEAYEKNPLKLCKNFEDFLEFVLPYRIEDEPLEAGKRKELFQKFKWVHDSLKVKRLDDVIGDIYKRIELSSIANFKYSSTPSLSQIEDLRFGYCNHLIIYFVSVLRSVGIPSGLDYVQRFGINYNSGKHSWLFYLTQNNFRAINVGGEEEEIVDVRKLYKYSSITKIYRKCFGNIKKDITKYYIKSFDFDIEVLWEHKDLRKENIYLGVFNPSHGWDKIDRAILVKKNKVYFKNIGSNIIYIVLCEINGKIKPLNYPFILKKNGKIHFFVPQKQERTNAIITRKYPPFYVRWRKTKMDRVKSIEGSVLQGSNTGLPEDFIDLYLIEKHRTTHNVEINICNKTHYKYYRLKGKNDKIVHLSNFKLLDAKGDVINNWASLELNNNELDEINKISDLSPLTYVKKKNLILTYSFNKPKKISGFQIQTRNDDNHIKKGDNYELFYWNRKWNSLGEVKAADTILIYQNIPKNALYWLKNHSRGKEEYVFSLDQKGKQFWNGVSEYKDIDIDSLLNETVGKNRDSF
jgi:hypothetical protein